MKNKIKLMLLMTLVAVALTACACNGVTATPKPSPSAMTTTPLPSPTATAEMTPMESGMSESPTATDNNTGMSEAVDTEALKMEVEKLSEVDTSDIVAHGDKAIVGLTFDAQYQGTLTDRIEQMIAEKIVQIKANMTNVAVTADPTLCTEIKTLAEETKGKAMTDEQIKKFDELYTKIKPAGTESTEPA